MEHQADLDCEINDCSKEQLAENLVCWWKDSGRSFPWREDASLYEIMVAEVLLQRTSAEKASEVYDDFISQYPDLESLAGSNEETLADILQPLGLHRKKASALAEIGEILSGEFPTSFEELHQLPQIGRYGANAILCFGLGECRPIVDTNVIRIYNRVFSLDLKDHRRSEPWELAEHVIPEGDYEEFNLALLDLGAEICTSSQPQCERCPIQSCCDYHNDCA